MREDKKEREALRDEERKRAEKQEKIRLKKEVRNIYQGGGVAISSW